MFLKFTERVNYLKIFHKLVIREKIFWETVIRDFRYSKIQASGVKKIRFGKIIASHSHCYHRTQSSLLG